VVDILDPVEAVALEVAVAGEAICKDGSQDYPGSNHHMSRRLISLFWRDHRLTSSSSAIQFLRIDRGIGKVRS
jgi:hypothetical protein